MALEADGHDVHGPAIWDDAASCLAVDNPELAVVGFTDPGDVDDIRRIRSRFSGPLVCFGTTADARGRVEVFRLGADDVVPSPLSLDELTARVQAVIRRADAGDPEEQQLLVCGPLAAHAGMQQIRVRGTWVQLTTVEFLLMTFLMRNARVSFTREELLRQVWGYEIGDMSTVSVHVRRLRRKLEQDPTRPALIRTVWGSGYYYDSAAEDVTPTRTW